MRVSREMIHFQSVRRERRRGRNAVLELQRRMLSARRADLAAWRVRRRCVQRRHAAQFGQIGIVAGGDHLMGG